MLRTPIYNPGQLAPDQLERIFVVRTAELALLQRGVEDFAADRSRQHVYLIGRRGMGKTTLLLRLAHLCEAEASLAGLVPALLIEEQYGIGDLADFWLEVARAAAAALEPEAMPEALQDVVDGLRDQLGDDAERLAEAVLAAIKRVLRRLGRRLLILLDNFDDVLEAIADERAQHRLREELQENREVLLVAASARAAEGTMRYDAPFYDFFRVYRLEPLGLEDVRRLLVVDDDRGAERRLERLLEDNPARLHGIRGLTGGNPRLVVLARRLLRDSPLGSVRTDLDQLLDDVTPYYKHLIEDIPRQGRRVFHALAGRWDPATAEDLEGELRLPRNQISAQLSRLHRDGWLEELDTPGRAKTYQLASRLFNLYYVMRFRRVERERLRYWVLFVEAFYGRERGERAVAPYTLTLGQVEGARRTSHLSDAFDAASVMCDDGARLRAREGAVSAALGLGMSRELEALLAQLPAPERAELERSVPGRYEALRRLLESTEAPFEGFDMPGFAERLRCSVSLSLDQKGVIATALGTLAREQLEELDRGLRGEGARMVAEVCGSTLWEAWRRAAGSGRLGDNAAAAFGRLWAEIGGIGDASDDDVLLLGFLCSLASDPALDPEGQRWLGDRLALALAAADDLPAVVWSNLGNLLQVHLGRYEDAEAAYRRAIELDPADALPWNNLGDLLRYHLGRYDEAEEAYRRAIELDADYARPWFGLGSLLRDPLGRYDEAEAAYRRATGLDPAYALPWYNLGNLLQVHLGRYDEAEAAYRRATELDPAYALPWNNLGSLLQYHLGRYEDAEAAYRHAIELDAAYARPWYGLGNLLQNHLERYDEAEAAYRRAIDLDPDHAFPWNNLGHLLQYRLGRYDEAEAAYRRAIERSADPMLRNSLAWHLCEHGAPETLTEACALAREAVAGGPEDPDARHTLACTLLAAGEIEAAVTEAAVYVRLADEAHLERVGRDAVELAARLLRAGRGADLRAMIEASPVPEFWAPVRLALRVRLDGDVGAYARVAQEIGDSARAFLARVDG